MKRDTKKEAGLLSATEIGTIVGVTGRTILNWEAAGLIVPAIRIGRVVRFDERDVLRRLSEATLAASNDSSIPQATPGEIETPVN